MDGSSFSGEQLQKAAKAAGERLGELQQALTGTETADAPPLSRSERDAILLVADQIYKDDERGSWRDAIITATEQVVRRNAAQRVQKPVRLREQDIREIADRCDEGGESGEYLIGLANAIQDAMIAKNWGTGT